MRALLLCMLPCAAVADPTFKRRALPVEHVYTGGWEHFVGGGVAVFDCNSDGFADMYMAGGESPARLFVNKTNELGGEVRFSSGKVAELTGVTGAYPLDMDADGLLDLMILRVGPNRILKGSPDCTFTDVTERWGFETSDRWSTAFSATWEDGRSWPTLAIGNYVDRSDPDGPFEACDVNALYRHDGETYLRQDLSPGFCALSMLFSDWNRDGTQDLRVSNDRHYYVSGGAEQMWDMPDLRLLDGEGWEPISIWGMGIASQDLTGDGRPEVVLTSMGDQLMQIAGPQGYSAAPFDIGSYAHRPYTGGDGRPSTGWHAEFGDVDNDGLADLFIAKGNVDQMPGMATKDPNNLLMQGTGGRFTEHGDRAGLATFHRSRGASLADFNRDGLLDIIVVNRRAEAELYENMTQDAGTWLSVSLSQDGPNRQAVGSWVEVEADGKKQTQEVTVGGGHVSGKAVPLHFGLGTAGSARLRVIWPDGSPGDWQRVDARGEVRVVKP
ncbi:MAG: CRTAC1 family protein [Pseudomonadota bacterium]